MDNGEQPFQKKKQIELELDALHQYISRFKTPNREKQKIA